MKQAYLISQGLEEFTAAREQFSHLVNELQSDSTLGMEHGDVEQIISREGNELLRRLLQGHLDLRCAREPKRGEVIGADGEDRTHCRKGCERTLMSLFGEVTVKRMGYGARGKDSVYPLDSELNLAGDKYSHGLRQRVVQAVSRNSFDAAVANVERTTGGKVPKRQAEEIAVEVSQDFVSFYDKRQAEVAEETSDPLIMSEDGKGIVMRTDGLREATRKAAEKQPHPRKARLSKGEKRKRMAMVGTVYSLERHDRTPASIMGREEAQGTATTKPRARNKRVWASVERDHEEVTDEIFQEARRRDPEKRRDWIMLVDGHQDQLKNIRVCMKRHEVEVVLILDFIHVLEYLWKAAYCCYPPGSEEAEVWVAEKALQILNGNAGQVAGGMRRSATLRELPPEKRAAVDDCADYLIAYKDMLKYDDYLAAGLPIATGVIEGACRHLINDRMAITGARWGLQRAEAVLKLRSLQSSGDADAYWDFYKVQSLKRNHLPGHERSLFQEAA
jgi:hypothetical protein